MWGEHRDRVDRNVYFCVHGHGFDSINSQRVFSQTFLKVVSGL